MSKKESLNINTTPVKQESKLIVHPSFYQDKSEFIGSEQNKSFGDSKFDNTNVPVSMVESGDYNYLRGEKQSNVEKWGVGISRAALKLGTRTLNGVVSPIYGVGSAIKNADWSKIWDNDVNNLSQDAEKAIDEAVPMYSTKAAEDAKGFAKLGYVNTWAGDILDGISYSGGALLSGNIYSKALSAFSKLASLDKLGMTVAEAMGQVTKIEDAPDKIKFVVDLTNKAKKLKNGLNNIGIASIGATTEASANGLNDANEFERQMIAEITAKGAAPTEEELARIKELRKSVGNSSYAMNFPIIVASNILTFGKVMVGNTTTEKSLLKGLAGRTEKDLAINSYIASVKTPIQSLLNKTYGLRKALGTALPEGVEEWEQLLVTKGVNDYYTKKFYNKDYNDFQGSFAKGLNDAMSSEGLENFMIGAISGGIFGNATQIKTEGLKSYKNPYNDAAINQTLDYLNNIKGQDAFKETVGMLYRHANLVEQQDAAIASNDNFEINNNKSDMFINYANHMINAGKTEDLKSELESYKNVSSEEFEQILGIKLGQEQLTNTKESVNTYINKRLDKIQKIEQLSNSIDELQPNLSKNIKDRFMYTAWTLEDSQDRIKELKNDVSFKLTKDGGVSNVVALNILNDLPNLTTTERNAAIASLEGNLKVNPLLKQDIINKVTDLNKLTERQEQFTKEFNALSDPKTQAILNELDKRTEDQVADTLTKENIKDEKQQAADEAKAQMDAEFAKANSEYTGENPVSNAEKLEFADELDEVSQFVADKIINRVDPNEQLTPEEQEIYDNNKDEIEAYIKSKTPQTNEPVQNTQVVTPTPVTTPTEGVEFTDAISNGITQSLDDKLNIDSSFDIGEKEFSSTRANALMMKFFQFLPNTKSWLRGSNGEVIEESKPDVSTEVNNPNVANTGETLTYEHNGTDILLKDKAGRVIGFIALPHATSSKDPKVLAALEKLNQVREYILSKPTGTLTTIIEHKGNGKLLTKMSGGLPILDQQVSSRKEDMVDGIPLFLVDNGKGLMGKNLTAKQEKVANVFISTSFVKEDKGLGRVYQAVRNASGGWFVIPVYTKLIGETNNSGGVIATIIQSLRDNITSASTINYEKLVADLNKYIFITSTKKYASNKQALRIKDDESGTEPGSITVGGATVSFTELKQGVNLHELEQALGTIRHNLSLQDLNLPEYQTEIADALTTNAYTSEGQYYVQPYIEVGDPQGFTATQEVKTKTLEDIQNHIRVLEKLQSIQPHKNNLEALDILKKELEEFNNTTDNNLTTDPIKGVEIPKIKPSFDVNNFKIDDNEFGDANSKSNLGGREVTQQDIAKLAKILPGIGLADAKLVQEVGKNLVDTYGMFQGTLIYLFKGATNKTLYHEAFHGVYRNVLSSAERIALNQEARIKYAAPTKEDLDTLRKAQPNLSNEVLEQLYYEEKLADDFAEYADGKFNQSLGQRILSFFKKLFNLFNIFRNSNNNQIEKLFDAVTTGQYAKRSLASRDVNIDIKQFGNAYSRVFTNEQMPLTAELERTSAIASALLDGIAQERFKGTPLSGVSIQKISKAILEQYKDFWVAEDAKPDEVKDKRAIAIAVKITGAEGVEGKFAELLENAKKQISMTRKITIKGNFIEINDVEGTEDTTKENEDTTKMEGNTEKGFQEMTAISGIKSATHEIKLFLSNVPVLKDGVAQTDLYGFTQFYPFEKLYYKLETSLIGTTTFKEQLATLEELSRYSSELKQVYDILVSNPDANFAQQFAANFNKQVLNYKLITYTKKKDSFEFSIMDPNRTGVKLNLKTQWEKTNILDPSNKETDEIKTFNSETGVYEADKVKISALVKSYRDKGEVTDKGKVLTPKLSVDEVYELAHKLGIGLSYDTIVLEAGIKGDTTKPSLEVLTDLILNYAETKWINPKNTSRQLLDKLVTLETSAQTELFTSSFNNVENSVVYAIQHQSFASKLVDKLSHPTAGASLAIDLQRDNMNFKNSVLKNRTLLTMFALDGLKMSGDSSTGKKFNQIDSDDYLAMIINMYLNTTANSQNTTTKSTALYAPIIPAEKGLAFGFTGVKYSIGLTEDGKIDANTEIVNEFRQLFFNELARIRQTMIDKEVWKNSPEKFRDNYHTGKELGLKFNLTNAINSGLKAKLDTFLESTMNLSIDQRTAPDGLRIALEKNKALFQEVNDALVKDLEGVAKTSLEKLISKGVITQTAEGLTSNKITTKDTLENVSREWALNSYLFNINNSLLINGDPAFYKGEADLGKRFYQGYSMLKFADTSTIDNSYKFIKDGLMKVNVISDVQVSTKSTADLKELSEITNNPKIQELANNYYNYNPEGKKPDEINPINSTNAEVFVSVALYSELQRLFGISSAELQEGFTNADLANVMNKNNIGILAVTKPFFYGVQWNAEYNRYEPIQVKCSIFPLTNKYTATNPILAKHKAEMDKDVNYPQVIAFESAMKALSPFKADIQDASTPSIVTLDLNNFGEQVANPDHMLESENSSLRQFKMLMYGMVESEQYYGDKKGRELKNEIAALDKANIEESLAQVVKGFEGNKRELNEFIQKAITARNSTSIVEKIFELKEDNTFQYPLDLINPKTTIQLISSIFSGEVIRQSFKGGSAVQATAMGLHIAPQRADYKNPIDFQLAVNESKELSELQTTLKWVRKGDINPKTGKVESIAWMEVAAPYYVKEFINEDGSIKDNIPDEMREMLIYRIPTEGAHSMMAVKVVHFLPSEYKGVILMPLEVTTQFGADFDFDKVNFLIKDYRVEKGEVIPYKFIDGDGENAAKLRYTEVIKYVLKSSDEAKKLVKVTNAELESFDYKLNYQDKAQLLIDAGLLPLFEDFSNLSIIEQNIKPARNNRLLNNYNQILRSVNMLESLITPSGPGAIEQIYNRVKKSINNGNFFTPMFQVFNKDLFHKISQLKGVAALQVSGHAWATEGNLIIRDKVVKGIVIEQGLKILNAEGKSETRKNLSSVLSDGKAKIVEELSSMMAVILDAVKTPDQLPSIGISMKTLPMWSYLVRLGLGSNVASQYTSQPAIKDLSAALESNDKQLKNKSFVKKDVATVRNEWLVLYQDAVNKALARAEKNLDQQDYFELVDYIEKNTLDRVQNFNKLGLRDLDVYTGLTKESLSNEETFKAIKAPYEKGFRALPEYKKLKFIQLQITTLNVFEESENIIKQLGELNQLFNINKETGPNFEDINGKIEIFKKLSKEDTLIEGIDVLLQTDAIKPYMDTVQAEYAVLAKHYNFASDFFNAVKSNLAEAIYGDPTFTRIKAEDREPINGFVQMFLDAENTYKPIYTDENRVAEADFVNDIKVILSSKLYPAFKFKSLGGKEISPKHQQILKDMTLFQSLESKPIKNSSISYLGLKGDKYELNQKEAMIDDLRRLYNSPFKEFAVRLIQHSFINTGMYTGVQSYFNLIDPSILQDMGLVNDRQVIRQDLQSSFVNEERIEQIVDQLVRNNAKKFTKSYDNESKLFTVINGGKAIVLNGESTDTRKQELVHRDGTITKYIRFKLDDIYTPIYKLENTEGQILYTQVTYLGQPGKRIEINPFGEVETEFPHNKYENFNIIARSKTTNKVVDSELQKELSEIQDNGSEDTTENISSTNGQAETEISKEEFLELADKEDLEESKEIPNLEVINPEITKNKPKGLPGIDRTNNNCK